MTPEEIKKAPKFLGLSVADTNKAIGVNRSTWDKWTAGTRTPGKAAIKSLRHLLWLNEKHPEILTIMLNEM